MFWHSNDIVLLNDNLTVADVHVYADFLSAQLTHYFQSKARANHIFNQTQVNIYTPSNTS